MFIKAILGAALALVVLFISTSLFAADTPTQVKHVDAAQARALLAGNPDIVVLDVRTKGEYKRGHIAGAVRNNYFNPFKFKKRLRKLDRTKPYLVHCKSGHRSKGAVKIMVKEGFTNITHLDGGYDAWKKLPPEAT